jgi:hypothetical protein
MRRWTALALGLDLHEVRLIVVFIFHSAVVAVAALLMLIGHAAGAPPALDVGVFLVLAHGLSFRRLPVVEWLQEWLIRTWTCRDCSMEIALIGRWRCPSCSFVSSPRHAFSSCPGG